VTQVNQRKRYSIEFTAIVFVAVLSSAAWGTAPAEAQEPIDVDDEAAAIEMDSSSELSDAEERALVPLDGQYGSEVEQMWRARLENDGLSEGENDRDVFIASGLTTVAMEKGNPGWIESRRIAYDIAFARAKASLVSSMGQRIQQTGSARFTSNAGFGQGQIQEIEAVDQTARILDKAGDLTEATLDAALREIDPNYSASEYDDLSMPERQVVLEDLFEQSTYRAAARVIAGASTYTVLEGPSHDGNNHEILVGLVWSPRLSALAAAIQEGRTSMPVDGVRVSAEDLLPSTVGEAVSMMGTRVFIDENGDRALLSFVQTEPAQVSAADADMARRAAISTAEDLALGQIAAFVGENVTLESEVQARQLTQVYADLVQRGVEIETEQVQTIRSATGRVNITGANTIWTQVLEHPETEQDLAAVAVVWSPSGQAMGDRMGSTIDSARDAGTEAEQMSPEEGGDASEESMTFERETPDPDAF